MPLVYDELHRQAQRYMSHERAGPYSANHRIGNEVYLRLVDSAHAGWESRTHFFGVCAQVMRRILVDWARSRQTLKRGGNVRALDLDEALAAAKQPGADLVAVDDALKSLAVLDPRKGQVVEMRFFGGLSVKKTAEVPKVSPETGIGSIAAFCFQILNVPAASQSTRMPPFTRLIGTMYCQSSSNLTSTNESSSSLPATLSSHAT